MLCLLRDLALSHDQQYLAIACSSDSPRILIVFNFNISVPTAINIPFAGFHVSRSNNNRYWYVYGQLSDTVVSVVPIAGTVVSNSLSTLLPVAGVASISGNYSFYCQNGATCIDGTSDNVQCICPSTYTGSNCEILVNNCTSMPCVNGGSCAVDLIQGYRCTCPFGFIGLNCQINNRTVSSSALPPMSSSAMSLSSSAMSLSSSAMSLSSSASSLTVDASSSTGTNVTTDNSTISSTGEQVESSSSSNIALIVGVTVGAVVVAGVLLIGGLYYCGIIFVASSVAESTDGAEIASSSNIEPRGIEVEISREPISPPRVQSYKQKKRK